MQTIARTAASVAMAIAMATGLAVATASTAQAAPRDCPSGWLCLWEHSDASGRMLQFRDNRWQQLSAYGFNDKASSWRNRLGRDACLSWDWPHRGSQKIRLSNGGYSAHMGRWNDQASGVKSGAC